MLTLFGNANTGLGALTREMDRLLNDVATPSTAGWAGYGLCPPADIVETQAEYAVVLDLPGHDAKAIQIQVENDTLTVQSERKFAEPAKDATVHRSERAAGTFLRSFALPRTVDAARVEARYEDGVLTVTLPKREEAKPRTIQVQVR